MKNSAIRAQGLAKQYIVGGAEQQYDSFRDLLTGALLSPFRKFKTLSGNVAEKNLFWALKDLDFQINSGEVVGVIGHNGAGKSTLLKILSRITAPTLGRVEIHGRVASLLEVGTGFHPELTGRENIYLNGSILGMRRAQIDQKFDEIVEFADVTKFLDTPTKRYSSGMGVRLAFSVAAHLDTDVLLVDEVLAVGDQKFQEKCLGKLENVSSEGRTIIFVSHNLSSVSKLCSRVMVLDQGRQVFDGNTLEGISAYNHQMRDTPVLSSHDYSGNLYPKVEFTQISMDSAAFIEGQEIDPLLALQVQIEGQANTALSRFRTVLAIVKNGQLIFRMFDSHELTVLEKGKFIVRFEIPARLLLPGEHTLSIGGVTDVIDQWVWTRHYRFNVAYQQTLEYQASNLNTGLINIDGFGSRESISGE